MKTTMKGMEIEGTPEEILAIISLTSKVPKKEVATPVITETKKRKYRRRKTRYKNKYKRWDDKSIRAAVELYLKGYSWYQIGKQLERSARSIYNLIQRIKTKKLIVPNLKL